jgi:hypothetical protein
LTGPRPEALKNFMRRARDGREGLPGDYLLMAGPGLVIIIARPKLL